MCPNKMRSIVCVLILCLAALSSAESQTAIKEIIRKVSPSVVTMFSYDQDGEATGLGSGFIVDHRGLIVTNYHVIQGAYAVKVKMQNGDLYDVEGVVDFDAHRDFAILKVSAYGLPTIPFGNSSNVEVGDDVIAIGNPKGLEHTVSNGIVSQRRQQDGYTLLQITAPISSGSSGGPLVDNNGRAIGITTSTLVGGQNLNFAVPINYVRGMIETGTSVRYRLSDVAAAQAKTDLEALTLELEKLFAVYKDPSNYFSVVYPKEWEVRNSEGLSADKITYVRTTMMAPRTAHKADVDGYLSEGMRFTFRLPPKNKVWSIASVHDWAPLHMRDILPSNPGFVITDSSTVTLKKRVAKVYSMVGQNADIPEPEKTSFLIFAGKNFRLVVELVCPVSKLKAYQQVYAALLATFELSEELQ